MIFLDGTVQPVVVRVLSVSHFDLNLIVNYNLVGSALEDRSVRAGVGYNQWQLTDKWIAFRTLLVSGSHNLAHNFPNRIVMIIRS